MTVYNIRSVSAEERKTAGLGKKRGRGEDSEAEEGRRYQGGGGGEAVRTTMRMTLG